MCKVSKIFDLNWFWIFLGEDSTKNNNKNLPGQFAKLAKPVFTTFSIWGDFLWTCYLLCFDKNSWYLEVIWLSFDFFLSKFMGWKQQNQFLKPAKPVLAEFVQILSFFCTQSLSYLSKLVSWVCMSAVTTRSWLVLLKEVCR